MIIKITSDSFFLIYTLIIVVSFYLVDVFCSSIMSQLIILFYSVSFSNYHCFDYINQLETAIMKKKQFHLSLRRMFDSYESVFIILNMHTL
jgi:hypothetical protein